MAKPLYVDGVYVPSLLTLEYVPASTVLCENVFDECELSGSVTFGDATHTLFTADRIIDIAWTRLQYLEHAIAGGAHPSDLANAAETRATIARLERLKSLNILVDLRPLLSTP